MGVQNTHATKPSPEQAQPADLYQVRQDTQLATPAAQTPQTAYAAPSPNSIQATQTFFEPAPAPAVPGAPAPVVQGYSVGPINTTQPLYCPAQQVTVQLFAAYTGMGWQLDICFVSYFVALALAL